MTDYRSVVVDLVANITGYRRDVRGATGDTRELEGTAKRFGASSYNAKIGVDTRSGRTELSSLERELKRIAGTRYAAEAIIEDKEAGARLDALNARLDEFGSKVSDASVGVNDADARAKISGVEAALIGLAEKTADPEIDLRGIATAEAQLATLEGQLTKFDGQTYRANVQIDGTATAARSASFLADTIASIGPAAVAVGATGGAAFIGIAGAMTTAGVAGGILGITIAGQVASLKKQQKELDAQAKHLGTLTQGSEEYNAALAQYNAGLEAFEQQFGPLADAIDRAKVSWRQYLTEVGQDGLNEMIADALDLAVDALPHIERLVTDSAGSVDDLIHKIGEFARTPEAGAMLAFFDREGPAAIHIFGEAIGDVGVGIVALAIAFAPIEHDVLGGVQRVSQAFADWARNLPETEGLEGFMAYVERVGPKVWETLGAVAETFIAITTAAAPVGEATLPVIEELANILTVIADSPAGPTIFTVAAALAVMNRALTTLNALKTSALARSLTSVGGAAETTGRQVQVAGTQAEQGSQKVEQAGIRIQGAAARSLAAKGGFIAAGVGLEILASRVDESQGGLKALLTIAGGAAGGAAFGPLGAAIGAAGGALSVFAARSQKAADAQQKLDEFGQQVASTLNQQTGAITRNTVATVQKSLADEGAYDAARTLGISLDTVTQAALGNKAAQDEIREAYERQDSTLRGVTASQEGLTFQQQLSGDATKRQSQSFDELLHSGRPNIGAINELGGAYKTITGLVGASSDGIDRSARSIRLQREAAEEYARKAHPYITSQSTLAKVEKQLASETGAVAVATSRAERAVARSEAEWQNQVTVLADAKTNLQDYAAALHGLINTDGNAFDAQREITKGYIELKAAVKEGGTSLSDQTEAGNANIDMLKDSVVSVTDFIIAEKEAGKGPRDLAVDLKAQREELVNNYVEMGFSRDRVNELLDVYGLTPKLIATLFKATADTSDADTKLDKTKGKADDLGKTKPNVETSADTETTNAHIGVTQDAADELGRTRPQIEVSALTEAARRDMADFAQAVTGILGGIENENVDITLSAQAAKVEEQLSRYAYGGSVTGGIPGKDSVRALLMPGEHVNTEEEVTRLGKGDNSRGQRLMYLLRKMILRGEFDLLGDLQPFARGGEVALIPQARLTGMGGAVSAIERIFDAIANGISNTLSKKASDAYTHIPIAGQLGPNGNLTPAQIIRGQQFAIQQQGKPYLWGGVGPGGYDCSGFQSAILNAAVGRYPYSRLGSTASMPWAGSAPGVGKYTIGWTTGWEGGSVGHTSGNIGGLNVESYGGHGPAVGSGARSPLDSHFYGHMHYAKGGAVPYHGIKKMDTGGPIGKGYTLVYNGLPHEETVINQPPAVVADAMAQARPAMHVSFPGFSKEITALRHEIQQLRSGVLKTHVTNAQEVAGAVDSVVQNGIEQDAAYQGALVGGHE